MSQIRRPAAAWIAISIIGLVAVALLVQALLDDDVPREPVAVSGAPIEPARIGSKAGAPSVVETAVPQRSQPLDCRGRAIEVTIARDTLRQCLGAAATAQNGSIRTYRVKGEGDANLSLSIDAINEKVLRATLGAGSKGNFECEEGDCSGIKISRHDSQGLRTITLAGATLRRAEALADAATKQAASVQGEFTTMAEDNLFGLACTGPSLTINSSDGGAMNFCAMGGTGFELKENGDKTYEFASLDSGSIFVTVDEKHALTKIEYDEGRLACTAPGCAAVAIAAPDGEGKRNFSFGGTTLIEVAKDNAPLTGRAITLNGTLVLPSQQ